MQLQSVKPVVAALSLVLAASAPQAQVTTQSAGPYYATPSWDQTLPPATRYLILTNLKSQAVLDRETGLVWTAAPVFAGGPFSQSSASATCNSLSLGGRAGWRLPSIQELGSLLAQSSNPDGPTALDASDLLGTPVSGRTIASINSSPNGSPWQLYALVSTNPITSQTNRNWVITNVGMTSTEIWCVRSPAPGPNVQ